MDWDTIQLVLSRVGIAYLVALPVAWDREVADRSAGLRTFPLVATAATCYILLAQLAFPAHYEAQGRVLEGLITGIGFIGGGAILRERGNVHGTATAAAVWATAAIGAATAYGHYEIALTLSAISFATLRVMTYFKPESRQES